MADYIKRDSVLNTIHRFRGYIDEDMEWRMKYAINKISSADVVEVVRCKDCIHRPIRYYGEKPDAPYLDEDCGYRDYTCPYLCDDDYYNRMPADDWFCNHGERMDGE